MSESTDFPQIAILLGTYFGEAFLPQQLDSIVGQTFKNWSLIASDDGSTDKTGQILQAFQQKHSAHQITIHRGPGRGLTSNFLSLIVDAKVTASYYALCDQDDIWAPTKLSKALDFLTSIPSNIPALYCSRTRLIDENGRQIGYSQQFTKPPSFRNALMQNIAGGNTMVFNQALRQLVAQAGSAVDVPVHDWWLYILACATGGVVFYDHFCSVDYRVHGANVVGSNLGASARVARLRMLLAGRYKQWIDMNLDALKSMTTSMTAENKNVYVTVCEARRRALPQRALGMWRAGIYRQTFLANLALIAGVVLNKV
jgi:glycosyltransferase involved in cell wall biosynthesis